MSAWRRGAFGGFEVGEVEFEDVALLEAVECVVIKLGFEREELRF